MVFVQRVFLMRNLLPKVMLTVLVLGSMVGTRVWAQEGGATQKADGPTPYPAVEKEAEWPGKGPIRLFNKWMPANRKYFWTQREKSQGAVVFVGDSLTGNWKDMGKAFGKLKVANRGVGGDTSRGVLFRFKEDVLDLHPQAIVICCGTNDLTAHGSPMDAVSNIKDMLAMAEKEVPGAPVVVCTNPPSAQPDAPVKPGQREKLNEEIRKLASPEKKVVVLDLYVEYANADGSPKEEFFNKDKLHFSPAGHAKWAELIKPVFEKLGIKEAK